eukprot:scaffold1299_cov246-Pinguiococcus_pyrenoidosus.AAC.2
MLVCASSGYWRRGSSERRRIPARRRPAPAWGGAIRAATRILRGDANLEALYVILRLPIGVANIIAVSGLDGHPHLECLAPAFSNGLGHAQAAPSLVGSTVASGRRAVVAALAVQASNVCFSHPGFLVSVVVQHVVSAISPNPLDDALEPIAASPVSRLHAIVDPESDVRLAILRRRVAPPSAGRASAPRRRRRHEFLPPVAATLAWAARESFRLGAAAAKLLRATYAERPNPRVRPFHSAAQQSGRSPAKAALHLEAVRSGSWQRATSAATIFAATIVRGASAAGSSIRVAQTPPQPTRDPRQPQCFREGRQPGRRHSMADELPGGRPSRWLLKVLGEVQQLASGAARVPWRQAHRLCNLRAGANDPGQSFSF